jgi:phosphoenolpyruvate---glycerone phosphotransferase subunit DhaL
VETLDAAAVRAWISGFLAAFRSASAELDELDRQSGDGDFGSNLMSAVQRVEDELAAAADPSADEAFAALSSAFMDAGGTSGPLFGVWFREFARATSAAGLDGEALARASSSGLEAVCRLGHAGVGDKTMVDAMSPAADALADPSGVSRGLHADLADAAAAARTGADATAALVARRGRASYVGEVSRGVRDPGAVAVAMFFEAAIATQPIDA